MAGTVTSSWRRHAALRVAAVGLAGWVGWVGLAGSAWALGPGAPFVPPVAASSDAAGGPSATQPPGGGLAEGLGGVRLGRHAGALIDGVWVRVGEQARGATLVAVRRTSVSLRHPDGRLESMDLFPPQGGPMGAATPTYSELAKP